jgi:hypothetical protein
LLTHSQPSDERGASEQIETSIIRPRGGFTDKYKSEEEKYHKRITYTGLTVIAAIVVIAVVIGVFRIKRTIGQPINNCIISYLFIFLAFYFILPYLLG